MRLPRRDWHNGDVALRLTLRPWRAAPTVYGSDRHPWTRIGAWTVPESRRSPPAGTAPHQVRCTGCQVSGVLRALCELDPDFAARFDQALVEDVVVSGKTRNGVASMVYDGVVAVARAAGGDVTAYPRPWTLWQSVQRDDRGPLSDDWRGHLLLIVDYDPVTDKVLILESLESGPEWRTVDGYVNVYDETLEGLDLARWRDWAPTWADQLGRWNDGLGAKLPIRLPTVLMRARQLARKLEAA